MARPDDQPVSMLQGLQAVLGELGAMMAAPDADIQFLQAMQTAISTKIREGTQQAVAGQQQQATAAANPMAANAIAPGGGAGMSGFGGLQPQDAMGGMAPAPGQAAPGPGGIGMGNTDEMRRVLAANGQAQ